MGIYGDFSNAFKDVPSNVKYYMNCNVIEHVHKSEMLADFFSLLSSIWL